MTVEQALAAGVLPVNLNYLSGRKIIKIVNKN